jgi:hypothetical protein
MTGDRAPGTRDGAQALPFFDEQVASPLPRRNQAGVAAMPPSVDHEPATWYRLVTALVSCYAGAVNTADRCTFEIERSGVSRCKLAATTQWELALPQAAYSQAPLIVDLWRQGGLAHCVQSDGVVPGELRRAPSGTLQIEVLATTAPSARGSARVQGTLNARQGNDR